MTNKSRLTSISKKDVAISMAKHIIDQMADVMHSRSHMEQVLAYANEIASSRDDIDHDVLELAVWWHNVGRLFLDRGHPQRGAEMLEDEFAKIGFGKLLIHNVYDAVINHSSSKTPGTIEGKILRDADKLDFLTPSRWKLAIDNKKVQQ